MIHIPFVSLNITCSMIRMYLGLFGVVFLSTLTSILSSHLATLADLCLDLAYQLNNQPCYPPTLPSYPLSFLS
jgi:hypothetical protein